MAERALKSVPSREEAPERPDMPAAVPAPIAPEVETIEPAAAEQPPRRTGRQKLRWLLFALLPLALVVSGYWYVAGGQIMSTDDAYVDAEKVGISTDVAGIVKDVDVTDNQQVAAGQVLYHLDPRQFQIALDNAKANQAQTALAVDAMKQDYKRMLSDTAAQ